MCLKKQSGKNYHNFLVNSLFLCSVLCVQIVLFFKKSEVLIHEDQFDFPNYFKSYYDSLMFYTTINPIHPYLHFALLHLS